MTTPIVECVPNFSDARRPEVIGEIVAAIREVDGVTILDQHSDIDHNRTVVTFAGSPQGVEDAAYNAIETASKLIDLNEHVGEHPRIGATDVVPFVPISGVTMDECIAISQRLGQRVADKLGIPVYLYEKSATHPDRRNLARIRKGEYETLKQEIATNETRSPDYGPKKLGPAGATVIGAREFLIAYNVYLSTQDVNIAKNIAKAIRFSSGGLRYVKALGLLVEGQAQVSMNLTNFRKTPIAQVVEAIRREAQRYGVAISHAEVVGLIPQEALVDMAVWYSQMDLFELDQILERKMYALLQSETKDEAKAPIPIENFVHQLASGTPVPGGGSAAAYAGAMGAALIAMVAHLTLGKKKYADSEPQIQTILKEVQPLQNILLAAVEADSAAFEHVMAAYRLSKDTSEELAIRSEAIQTATVEAAQVPFETARKALRVIQLSIQIAAMGNVNAITDAGTAAALAQAAIKGAGYNVRINCLGIKDKDFVEETLNELENIEGRASQFLTQMDGILKDRGGLPLS